MNNQKEFSIKVLLKDTNEVFTVKNVTIQMTIKILKINLEIIAGIPMPLQRLTYLDEGDMEDISTLQHHDIVSGAQITMTMWRTWKQLIQACVKGNIDQVLRLGVTTDSNYRDPNSNFMSDEKRKQWFLERQCVALFTAAHRGHPQLMKRLITAGADVAHATKCGRTILHIAAAAGQDACIDLLLENGAGSLIKVEDNFKKTPLEMAAERNHKSSERRLFLFQWRVRASKMKTSRTSLKNDMLAHQMFDSTLKTHLTGSCCQMYCLKVLPPQEFEGTTLSAKLSKHYYKIPQGLSKSQKDKNCDFPECL